MRNLLRLISVAMLPCIVLSACVIEAPTFVDFSDGGSIDANELLPGDLEIVSGAALDFETVEIESASSATQSVTVRNTGAIGTVALDVDLVDETNYAIVTDTCAGVSLEPGASCSVELRFTPSIVGAIPTQLSVRDSPTTGATAQVDGSGSGRVQVDMTGTGMVVSVPAGISCGAGCPSATGSFVESPVTLTATDLAGFTFDGWSGACAGAGLARDCTVSLAAALTSVGASFRALACIPDSIDCNDATDHYIDCSPTGTVEVEMDCPLGCSTTSEQCVDVDPSNGLATYLDMARTGPDVAFTGSSTINTTNGVVFIGGTSITVPHALVGTTRIFMFNSLSIAGTLKVTGNNTLALVVDGDATITGTLDVSADGVTRGPGGRDPGSAGNAGTCDGSSRYTGSSNPSPGGGGAAGFSAGALGGAAGDGTTTSGGGLVTGVASAVPLRGGCAGGFTVEDPPTRVSHGGAGGGAVQIVSRTSISVTGSGKIDAGGGGGQSRSVGGSTTAAIGGGGGGAGGAILLEAPQVSLDGASVVVATKGGGGAAAGVGSAGHHGADGGTGAGAAAGGTNGALAGGGAGATETVPPVAGVAGSAGNDGGGGGGQVGIASFKNSGGALVPQNGAVIRSRSGAGFISTRLVP